MGIIYPISIAVTTTSVLFAHEMGHYYSASAREGDPDIPYMIPLGIGAVGVTRVRNLPKLSKRSRRYIIASGPIAGISATISLLPVAIVFGGKVLLITLIGMMGIELYNGTLGSDGKKRKMERG